MRGLAKWALFRLRDGFAAAYLDGLEGPAMFGLISLEQYSVI